MTGSTDKERLAELEGAVRRLKNMVTAQSGRVNLDYDPYSRGMTNGLILALSLFDDSEPEFITNQSKSQGGAEKWRNYITELL